MIDARGDCKQPLTTHMAVMNSTKVKPTRLPSILDVGQDVEVEDSDIYDPDPESAEANVCVCVLVFNKKISVPCL